MKIPNNEEERTSATISFSHQIMHSWLELQATRKKVNTILTTETFEVHSFLTVNYVMRMVVQYFLSNQLILDLTCGSLYEIKSEVNIVCVTKDQGLDNPEP